MRLIDIILVIIDADKQNFPRIIAKCLCILSVFDLLNRCIGSLVIFQFYDKCRFPCVRQRQEHNVCKSTPRWQLPYQHIVFSRTVVCKPDRTPQ